MICRKQMKDDMISYFQYSENYLPWFQWSLYTDKWVLCGHHNLATEIEQQ